MYKNTTISDLTMFPSEIFQLNQQITQTTEGLGCLEWIVTTQTTGSGARNQKKLKWVRGEPHSYLKQHEWLKWTWSFERLTQIKPSS